MNVFALDSAGKTAGVALWQNGALLYESYLAVAGTHSETLLALCDAAFRAAGLRPSDIGLFALNAGPGSFTGLRIGMGIVKGLAFADDTPCAPVSTLSALAHAYPADGLIAAALDARRGEVYCALFRRENGRVLRLTQDAALPAPEFAALALQHKGRHDGISTEAGAPERIVCLGDGARLLADKPQDTRAASADFVLCPEAYRFGRANGICLAAEAMLQSGTCVCAAALSPEYLRLSQAERERAARLQAAAQTDVKESQHL